MTRSLLSAGLCAVGVAILIWSFRDTTSRQISSRDGHAVPDVPVEFTTLGDLPIRILKNRGQAPAGILYYGTTSHHTLEFSHDAVSLRRPVGGQFENIVMHFVGASTAPGTLVVVR